MNATRATTPSATGNEGMVVDKPWSLDVESELVSTTSGIQTRDSSPPLLTYPPSEFMDVDAEVCVTDVTSNETTKSNPLSGIPASQFYGSVPEPEEAQPAVIADEEDSGEDQEQEAEVDNMLAVTQSSSGDWVAQYVSSFRTSMLLVDSSIISPGPVSLPSTPLAVDIPKPSRFLADISSGRQRINATLMKCALQLASKSRYTIFHPCLGK